MNGPYKCWHYPVDDVDEIARKRAVMAGILGDDELHL